MNTIAILITTFLRDSALYKTLQSIIDYYQDNYVVLIADQGYDSSDKQTFIDYVKSQISCEYYRIPFDSGLSYARNFLVQKAYDLQIPYCLVLADNISLTDLYNFSSLLQFLESNTSHGLVGFDLENSKCSWEYLMSLTPQGIQFATATDTVRFKDISLLKVDICRNVFLGKTETLLNLWDNELKLGEHELAFLEYKKRGYEVFWTDMFTFKKLQSQGSDEYKQYRKRFAQFLALTKQKLGISGWVIYPKERKRREKA